MAQPDLFRTPQKPWNAGRLIGPKAPLKPKHIWAIRQQLKTLRRIRDLAMFNCALDAKLRAAARPTIAPCEPPRRRGRPARPTGRAVVVAGPGSAGWQRASGRSRRRRPGSRPAGSATRRGRRQLVWPGATRKGARRHEPPDAPTTVGLIAARRRGGGPVAVFAHSAPRPRGAPLAAKRVRGRRPAPAAVRQLQNAP